MTAPVLLLIPGMLNDARLWAEVASDLRARADVRIADVSTQARIADMADDAWALLADVPAEVPCVLAGFSLGGYVAIEMLARPRRTWRAAALLSTSCLPESPEGVAGREKAIAAFTQDFEGTLQGIARRGVARNAPPHAARTFVPDDARRGRPGSHPADARHHDPQRPPGRPGRAATARACALRRPGPHHPASSF